jgi:hypothetical protein
MHGGCLEERLVAAPIFILIVLVLLLLVPLLIHVLRPLNPLDSIVRPISLVLAKLPVHGVNLAPLLIQTTEIGHAQWRAVLLVPVWRMGARALLCGRRAPLACGAASVR